MLFQSQLVSVLGEITVGRAPQNQPISVTDCSCDSPSFPGCGSPPCCGCDRPSFSGGDCVSDFPVIVVMATRISSNAELLQSELECTICQEHYIDPVELPCHHNFCRKCIIKCYNMQANDWQRAKNCVDCPICRHQFHTSKSKLEKMPLNLKLRNIVAALAERKQSQPGLCPEHGKPHVILCYDCDDIRCLTCFLRSCAKSGHSTEEMETAMADMRAAVAERITKCDEEITRTESAMDAEPTEAILAMLLQMAPVIEALETHRQTRLEQEREVSVISS